MKGCGILFWHSPGLSYNYIANILNANTVTFYAKEYIIHVIGSIVLLIPMFKDSNDSI